MGLTISPHEFFLQIVKLDHTSQATRTSKLVLGRRYAAPVLSTLCFRVSTVIVQIDRSEWREIADSICLCTLPVKPEYFEQKYNLKFDCFDDEGLGRVKLAFVKIENKLCYLEAHLDGPDICQKISVYVLSYETHWHEIIEAFLSELHVGFNSFPWVQTELQPNNWELYRIDDNGNEATMHCFPTLSLAKMAQHTYESRGHKQLYLIRQKI